MGRAAGWRAGAQPGSGVTALPRELARSRRINLSVTEGQEADLKRIAEAWQQPRGTVAYAFVARFLSQARDQCLKGGQDVTLSIGASIILLRAAGFIVTREKRDAPADG